MKNCCVPVPTEQKKLLKVITCLYENYILNNTPSTDAYFANPTSVGYTAMYTELNALNDLINNYLQTNKYFVDASGNNVAVVNLWSAAAEGMVQYSAEAQTNTNSFVNAIANTITVNGVINNVGVLKPVQKLNMDECAEKTYQVTPVVNVASEGNPPVDTYTNVTQASLVERVGCAGVSNLGFLAVTLQVPIAHAPFNTCYLAKC